MSEVWKPIAGFVGRYEVSDAGRVRSLRFRGHAKIEILTGTDLGGYVRYDLRAPGVRRMVFGHILVLETFVGPCPAGMEGCHGDGNRANNRLGNLRWDTQVGNQADRLAHGTDSRGEKSGKAKITEVEARKIISRRKAGERVIDIAADYGVTGRTVYQIANGERWGHLKATA